MSMPMQILHGVEFESLESKNPNDQRDLWITVEEILHGCTKKLTFVKREKIDPWSPKYSYKYIDMQIEIKPGTLFGTKYLFEKLGGEHSDDTCADVVYVARKEPHFYFKRYGDNIVNTQLISQLEADNGVTLKIPTLERDKFLEFKVAKFENPNGLVKMFPHYGLPNRDNPSKRGDLNVNYEIVADELRAQDLQVLIEISLEEIFHSCTKEIKYAVPCTSNSFVEIKTFSENKLLNLEIKKGTLKYCIPRCGHKRFGCITGDVVFICRDKPHPYFKRIGSSLRYTARISSKQDTLVDIPLMDNRTKTIEIGCDSLIEIPGEGFPYSHDPNKKGDMIVHILRNFEVTSSKSHIVKEEKDNDYDQTLEEHYEFLKKEFENEKIDNIVKHDLVEIVATIDRVLQNRIITDKDIFKSAKCQKTITKTAYNLKNARNVILNVGSKAKFGNVAMKDQTITKNSTDDAKSLEATVEILKEFRSEMSTIAKSGNENLIVQVEQISEALKSITVSRGFNRNAFTSKRTKVNTRNSNSSKINRSSKNITVNKDVTKMASNVENVLQTVPETKDIRDIGLETTEVAQIVSETKDAAVTVPKTKEVAETVPYTPEMVPETNDVAQKVSVTNDPTETKDTTETAPETRNATETVPEIRNATETAPETRNATETAPETKNATETAPETKNATETAPETRNTRAE